jgi:hypothetical protein
VGDARGLADIARLTTVLSWRALGRVLLALGGLTLIACLVHNAGPDRVAHVMWQAGQWLPVILALELAQMVADVLSLRSILRERAPQIPPATWLRSSALSYAMMILAPAGRAAGEVGRATLLSKHIGAPRAATASTKLQAAYLAANGVLSAAACGAVASKFGIRSTLALLLAANVFFQAVIATALIALLLDARIGRWLDRMRRRWIPGAKEAPPVDEEARRRLPWQALCICTLARATQVVQYGVILHAVGGVVTVRNAFIAHGIHLVGASIGDLVPNQLGVVDGTYLAFAKALGFGDAPARALSIAFVAHIVQLMLAGVCVLVVTLTKNRAGRAEAAAASARAGARA